MFHNVKKIVLVESKFKINGMSQILIFKGYLKHIKQLVLFLFDLLIVTICKYLQKS